MVQCLERLLTFDWLIAYSTAKISILFLYLRMTPERSHKIAIYVIMGLIGAHEVAALVVWRFFPELVLTPVVIANTYIGRDLSMHTNQRILGYWKSTSESKMHWHSRVWWLQQRVVPSGRSCNLGPSHSRHLEAQSTFRTKDGSLDPRRHQFYLGHLCHRPYGLSDHLDAFSRHLVELPSYPIPREHGGLCRSHDLVGSSNLSIISKAGKEAKLLGSSAATNGVARKVVG